MLKAKLVLVFLVLFSACSKNSNSSTQAEQTNKKTSNFETIDSAILSPTESELLKGKGQYLSEIAACGSCHSSDGSPKSYLSGGRKLNDEFGEVVVPNITSDKDTGVGSWSVGDIKKAIREGYGKNNSLLSPSAHRSYRWLSDEDSNALAIYLLSTEPRKNSILKRELTDFKTKKWGLLSQHAELQGYVPTLPEKAGGYRGLYLVNFVSNCARCHSPSEVMSDKQDFLNGFNGTLLYVHKNEEVQVPSIRGSEKGIKNWSEQKIVDYLSKPKDSSKICPTGYYSFLKDNDKKAIAIYLKSLK